MGLDMYLTNSKFELVAYWRKAYQIDLWLNLNVNKTGKKKIFKVSIEQLKSLLLVCKNVLNNCELEGEKIVYPINNDLLNKIVYDEVHKHYYSFQGFDFRLIKDSKYAKKHLPNEYYEHLDEDKDYNGNYLNDVKYTIDVLEKIINKYSNLKNKEKTFWYESWY